MEVPVIYRRHLHEVESSEEVERGAADSGNETTEPTDSDDTDRYHFIIPEDRKLGYVSTTLLIVNRMIGTGIFSTPSSIIQATNSVGVSLLFWLLGGFMTFWLLAYLELGTALPRSGGEKVYLERIYRRPKYLASCIFAVEFMCFSVAAANTVNFSAHIIRAAKGQPEKLKVNCGLSPIAHPIKPSRLDDEWVNKGIGISTITFVCLLHALLPKVGIWISNALGVFKLTTLLVVVCTGFAALSGRMVSPKTNNFSSFNGPGNACEVPPYAKTTQAANYALAILQTQYAYLGWEGANYVLTEVRNAPHTLKRAAPTAVIIVTTLYMLANVAYFAGSTKSQIANSGVTVAAGFFEHVWGPSRFVTKVLPVIISLSALGNVFAQTFANSRVKQELAKEGLLPFSKFWASDWPSRAPSGGILLHWIFTVALIVGPRTSDAYPFISSLFTYTQSWIKISIGIGLLYLNFNKKEGWREQRTVFHTSPIITAFWVLSLAYVLIAPFMKNTTLTPTIPWYVVPTLGCSMLFMGTIYWLLWAKVWPMFGHSIRHEIEQLPDGSEVVRYVHVSREKH